MPRPGSRTWQRGRAVSKGLPYLYFKTKEALFKAVVKSVITAHFDVMREKMETTELSSEAFLKGPFLSFLQELVGSQARVHRAAADRRRPQASRAHQILLRPGGVAGHRHAVPPDRARHRARRVQADAACATFPQLLVAPVLTAIFWRELFERHHHLDTDALLKTNIDLLTDAIRAPGREPRRRRQGRGAMTRRVVLLARRSRRDRRGDRAVHLAGQSGRGVPGLHGGRPGAGRLRAGRPRADSQRRGRRFRQAGRCHLHAGKLRARGFGGGGEIPRRRSRGAACRRQGRIAAAGRGQGARSRAQRGEGDAQVSTNNLERAQALFDKGWTTKARSTTPSLSTTGTRRRWRRRRSASSRPSCRAAPT